MGLVATVLNCEAVACPYFFDQEVLLNTSHLDFFFVLRFSFVCFTKVLNVYAAKATYTTVTFSGFDSIFTNISFNTRFPKYVSIFF